MNKKIIQNPVNGNALSISHGNWVFFKKSKDLGQCNWSSCVFKKARKIAMKKNKKIAKKYPQTSFRRQLKNERFKLIIN